MSDEYIPGVDLGLWSEESVFDTDFQLQIIEGTLTWVGTVTQFPDVAVYGGSLEGTAAHLTDVIAERKCLPIGTTGDRDE